MRIRRSPTAFVATSLNYVRDDGWPPPPTRRKPAERGLVFVAKAPIRAMRWCARFLTAPLEARRLQRVYHEENEASSRNAVAVTPKGGYGLERCDIRYINLDRRLDRRKDFDGEMRSLGVSWHVRVSATAASPGILGCGISHTQLLRAWKRTPHRLLFVCEDDAEFTAPRSDIDALIEEFVSIPALKVLALANRTAWHIPISEGLAISSDIQTTAAYIVKPEIIRDLGDVFDSSVQRLAAGAPSRVAALDKAWKALQREQIFAVPRSRCVVQRSGYSDIQNRAVNYHG